MDKHSINFILKCFSGVVWVSALTDLENTPLSLVFPSDSWIKITLGIVCDTECQSIVQINSRSPWSFKI